MNDDDKLANSKDDEKIITEAKRRFAECEQWETYSRQMYVSDYEFGHGDSDNMAQWPDQLLTTREVDQKPTLTVNKTRVHCLQIINDGKQNKAGIVVHPTTNEATYDAAEVYEDVVRHIEYISRAQQAYDKALYNTVFGGFGFCRVVTEYTDNEGFDQDIYIRGVPDPLTIYMDPDAKEADKSDAEFAFVFDDMSREKFKRLYPNDSDAMNPAPSGFVDSWIGDNHIRVAEYWRKNHKQVRIASFLDDATGERVSLPKRELEAEIIRELRKLPEADYRERDTDIVRVECFKIAGSKIVDRFEWAGIYIPIVPCVAEEIVLNGQMDRKSHVRYMKDPQRIYNYNTSASVEFGALQTKTPFFGPAQAFEGYEEYYANANMQNLGFIPFKHKDDQGQDIPPPRRLDPPTAATAYMKGMEVAQMEMMMASGQYQSQFGQNENATSGKAINERQRQGDNATYHFVDAQANMIRQVGRVVVDLIPKILDTRRVMRIRGEDGIIKNVVIDPNAPEAVQKQQTERDQVDLIFNPNIGRYGVEADVGPSFATRRQEAWNAFIQIITQSPNLIGIIGDLMFQNADFPGADEIAQRLRRMAPPAALGEGPNPEQQEMGAKMDQLMDMVEKLNGELRDKTADVNIKAFDALTKRLQAIGNAGPIVTPEQAQPLIGQAEAQMLQGGYPQTFGGEQAAAPLPPGAQQMAQPMAPMQGMQ